MNPVFTIGHSNHTIEALLALLKQHAIQAIGDVRSAPYSRYNPQFDRETLKASLQSAAIHYVYLGKELGARSDDPRCYLRGKVQFDKLAESELFQAGLRRVTDGSANLRLALLCAEKEPLECHRTILVARQLFASGVPVKHILADGQIEPHPATIERLLSLLRLDANAQHLFRSYDQLVDDAYKLQEHKIAYDGAAAA